MPADDTEPPGQPQDQPEPTFQLRRRHLPQVKGNPFGYIRTGDVIEMLTDPAEHVEETVKNRRATRRLAYVVLALGLVLGLAIGIFAARVSSSDARNSRSNDFSHALACLVLSVTKDTPVVHGFLTVARRDYPDCPGYNPPPTPTPSTTTKTVRPRTNTSVIRVPGGLRTVVVTPGKPPARVVTKPGGTSTKTRTKTVTTTPSCVVNALGQCLTLPRLP